MAKELNRRSVRVLDVLNNVELEYSSIRLAAADLKISRKTITSILTGEHSPNIRNYNFILDDDVDVEESTNVNTTSEYDFYNGQYSWKSNKVVNGVKITNSYSLPLETADRIFFEYSRYGLKLSELQVRINHNISLPMWNSMKHRLQLYKESDIFSPITRQSMSDEEYLKLIDEKLKEQQDYRRRAVVQQYDKYQVKEAERLNKIAYDKQYVVQSILSELSEWYEDRKTEKLKIAVDNACINSDIIATIADIHIGAEIPQNYYSNKIGYSSKIVRSILAKIAQKINAKQSKSVTLFLLGDLIHSFTGTMHKNAFKQMEHKLFGAKLVKIAVEILEEFFGQINNLTRVISIAGNHDRSSDDFKADTNGEIAEIIMYILERSYADKIKVEHDPYLFSSAIDNIQYIAMHGHTASTQKQDSLILDYGSSEYFNLILSAHKHTREIVVDTSQSRHLCVPSIYTGDEYSVRAGYSATPGCLIIENQDDMPQVFDVTISL